MKIAICDDDNLRIEIFKNSIDRYLKEHGDGGYTLTTYTSGKPLIDDVSDGEWYDIIILDVSINGENGIEIAKRLRKIGYYGNITFWTERKEYVFDALDVLPVHYIIKGSEHGRMYSVVEQTLENIREKTLTIKNKNYFHRAEFRNIEYIESQNKYIMIHCTCGISHKERGKLNDIEKSLDGRFLRCHQSYIVNKDEVSEVSHFFTMVSGAIVPIRQRELAKIREKYENYVIGGK